MLESGSGAKEQRLSALSRGSAGIMTVAVFFLAVSTCDAFRFPGIQSNLQLRSVLRSSCISQTLHMTPHDWEHTEEIGRDGERGSGKNEEKGAGRRDFLSRAAAGLCSLAIQTHVDSAAAEYKYERGNPIPTPEQQAKWGTRLGFFTEEKDGFDAIRGEIVELIKADLTLGPSLVRLSFHSAGTYDRISKTGGSAKGTIRFESELAHEANAGVQKILPILEPIKKQHPDVSYADLYTLAGAVSVEALGGPRIPWKGGRVDSMDPRDATPDGRLPDADKGSSKANIKHLRTIFGRMGLSDQEIVALSGAHNLGKCHYEDSGYEGEWAETPWKFDNSYFNILLHPVASASDVDSSLASWQPQKLPNGKIQYTDPLGVYIMLPSDLALLQDPKFTPWVDLYARNSPAFFQDFAKAYSKLLALGT